MITISKNENTRIKNEKEFYMLAELRGLSGETKPVKYEEDGKTTYIDNGSVFIEIDTGKIFFFDLENEEWKDIDNPSSGE